MVWDLADEVFDDGDSLLFKKKGREQRVLLTDILNINHSVNSSPERVEITLRGSGAIGSELVFNPPLRLPLTKNKMVAELIQRVDRAKNT